MTEKKDTTEEKILEAAKTVFIRKGMDGARMQNIADEAKINKALLHYYFRSKEKLFDAVFRHFLKLVFPEVINVIGSELPFREKLERIIDAYLVLLLNHPYLPGFILSEIRREPSRLLKTAVRSGISAKIALQAINEAMDRGEIIRMKPEHLLVNVVSMCVFPFAARPVVGFMLFDEDPVSVQAFYEERAKEVKQFVIRSIEPRGN